VIAEGSKEKRLHKGGVGPEMRSPAGLSPKFNTDAMPLGKCPQQKWISFE
jgi:hypothetical protein